MKKLFSTILVLGLLWSENVFARISIFSESSGYSSSGNFLIDLLILLIVCSPIAIGLMWDSYKRSRPEKYNQWTGERYYEKPKKKKKIFKRLIKPFKIQKLEVKARKRKNKN